MTQKKFRFEDLQPHVEMLCDAVENKGASSSGISHNAYECAAMYRILLSEARAGTITFDALCIMLDTIKNHMLEICGCQHYRLNRIAEALDFFIKKEYNK